MKLHQRLLLFFVLSSLLLLATGIIVNQKLADLADAQERNQIQIQVEKSIDYLEAQLSTLNESMLNAALSSDVNLMTRYDLDKNIGKIVEISKSLHSEVQALKVCFPFIEKIYIQFPNLQRQVDNNLQWSKLDSPLHSLLYSANGKMVLYDGMMYISHTTSLAKIGQTQSLIGCSIDPERLLESIIPNYARPSVVRMSLDGTVVATNGEFDFNTTITSKWTRISNGWAIKLPISTETLNGEIELEVFLPSSYVTVPRKNANVWALVEITLMIVALLLFTWLVQKVVRKPIQKMLGAFDQLSTGNMEVEIHAERKDEFAILYEHFNNTVKQLYNLFIKRHQAELAARNAELKHLQQQIHPHFLYNAFYQLYAICEMEGNGVASEFSLQLSRYYQYITQDSENKSFVTLEQELEHTRQYVYIQSFRYCDKLDVKFQKIPDEIMKICVPKLILQPIVENAIKHCLEKEQMEEKLVVLIDAQYDGQKVTITVDDNGKTMNDEKLLLLRERIANASTEHENSGMMNVHLRLHLCDEENGITIERSKLGGLKVTLNIKESSMSEY